MYAKKGADQVPAQEKTEGQFLNWAVAPDRKVQGGGGGGRCRAPTKNGSDAFEITENVTGKSVTNILNTWEKNLQ